MTKSDLGRPAWWIFAQTGETALPCPLPEEEGACDSTAVRERFERRNPNHEKKSARPPSSFEHQNFFSSFVIRASSFSGPLRVVFAAKKTGKMPVCPTDKMSVLPFCHASDRDHRRNFHRENDFCKLPA